MPKRLSELSNGTANTATAGSSTLCSLQSTAIENMSAAEIASACLRRSSPRTNRMSERSENRVARTMVRWTR